jgi:hypothetical protein
MILVGDTVIVDVVETGDPEDDYYCGLYNGKYGNVTAIKGSVCTVEIDNVERPCYFYEYELTKRQRPAVTKRGKRK